MAIIDYITNDTKRIILVIQFNVYSMLIALKQGAASRPSSRRLVTAAGSHATRERQTAAQFLLLSGEHIANGAMSMCLQCAKTVDWRRPNRPI